MLKAGNSPEASCQKPLIDHSTLAQLVAAGTVRGVRIVVNQVVGLSWRGKVERPLSAQRTRAVRLFRKFDTLVSYLKELGLSRYDVDASDRLRRRVSECA